MINKKYMQLMDYLNELASLMKFSEDQKKDLYSKLEKSVVMNIMSKLLDQLSENDKKELKDLNIEKIDELYDFLISKFSKEDLSKIFSQSTEEVFKDFLDKLD